MFFKSHLRRRLVSASGFSVVEVIVALGIFSVAILGLAVGAITITRANKTSENHTIAANLAQDRLEQLKALTATTFSAVMTGCTSYTSPGCSESNLAGGAFSRSWQVIPNSPPGINSINVKVDWQDYTTHTFTVISAR
jgi:Tfp pilus assembly protein PilV